MRKFIRIALTVLLTAAVLLGSAVGVILYRTRYAKTEITRDCSPDGRYTLTVYMLGEPDFPFGPAHCRFELSDGGKKVAAYDFNVSNDGGPALAENFAFTWDSAGAAVTVTAEEQEETVYILFFDGTVTASAE